MTKIDLDIDKVILLYKEKKNIHVVADFFGVSIAPILRILKKENIKLTRRKYFFNERYFEFIDTSAKAYLFGFLVSDGHLRCRNKSCELKLKVHGKDRKVLEFLKREIGYTGDIKKEKNTNCEYVNICSFIMADDLKNKGFTGLKKSRNNIVVPEGFVGDFIRGVFDADGTAFFSKRRRDISISTSIYCIGKYLDFLNIKYSLSDCRNYFVFRVVAKDREKFYKQVYSDKEFCLERKKNIIEKILGINTHNG